jgi:MFS family permease
LKKNFSLALFLAFSFYMLSKIGFFYFPVHLRHIGFSGLEIGLITAAGFLAAAMSFLPSGFFHDRKSVKKAILFSLAVLCIFHVFFSFSPVFILMIPVFFLGGVGLHTGTNSFQNYFFKQKKGTGDGVRFGLFSIAKCAGISFGILIVSILAFLFDFGFVLLLIAAGFALLFFFSLRIEDTQAHATLAVEYKNDLLSKEPIFFSILFFLVALHWGAEATSYGLFLQNNLGFDFFSMGLYIAASVLVVGASAYFFGKRIDNAKIGFRRVFLAGLFISGFFHILMTVPDPFFSFLFRAIHEFGDGMIEISFFLWVSRRFQVERVAGNVSIIMTAMLISQVIGSVFFGWLGSSYGYHLPLIVSGATSVFAGVLFMVFGKKYFN